MPLYNKCCCFSLQTGCKIIGIGFILGDILGIVDGVLYHSIEESSQLKSYQDNLWSHWNTGLLDSLIWSLQEERKISTSKHHFHSNSNDC